MIIGISGKAQSGKDTVCKMIQYCIHYQKIKLLYKNIQPFGIEHYEYCLRNGIGDSTFQKHSFAHKLKAMAAVLLEEDIEQFESIEFKNSFNFISNTVKGVGFSLTNRELLQQIGDKMREIDPDIWVKGLLNSYCKYHNWIIPDLRFKNEAKGIRETDANSILIRVENPYVTRMSHKSEVDLDSYVGWNYTIENNGTLEELLFKVRDILIKEKIINE